MRTKFLWVGVGIVVAAAAAAVVARGSVGGLITGKDIAPHSIRSTHLVDHTIQAHDLSVALIKSLQGKTGATGPAGTPGQTGAQGATGAKGDTGAAGPQGAKGDTGATGAQGAAGEQGPAGPAGPEGPPGQSAVSGYGFVVPGEVSLNVDPVLVAARSRNIDRVTSPAAGVFCLTPKTAIDAATRSWTVTPEKSRSAVSSNLMFAYADTAVGTCPTGQLAVRTYELNISKLGAGAVPSEHVAFMVVIP